MARQITGTIFRIADDTFFWPILLDFAVVERKSSTRLVRELAARLRQLAGPSEKFQRVSRIQNVFEIHRVGEFGCGNIAGFVQKGRGVRNTPGPLGESRHDSYHMGGGFFGGRGR